VTNISRRTPEVKGPNMSTSRRGFLASVLVAALLWALPPPCRSEDKPQGAARDVTFLSTSDSHYREAERKAQNERNHLTILEMNSISKVAWPEKLGGDPIRPPRGVVMLGDCIDDGDRVINGKHVSPEQYQAFVADFGLDGTDGALKYPVFESWGNHDGPPEGKEKNGFSFQAQLKKRNQSRKSKSLVSNLSENGLHYSWDWEDVHFVQLGIYPADEQREGIHYSPVWHDPQGALSFLRKDLADKVGQSGRPVVLMSHCGVDTDWWVPADWKEFYEAGKPYNVILYLYGHSGTGLREWAPEGEAPKWQCINDGNTTTGFFVIQITADRLRAAYRCKEGVKVARQPDKAETYEWNGTWGWRFLLDRKLAPPTAGRR
jgi:cytolysin (calcineurin-like family phosphatase)